MIPLRLEAGAIQSWYSAIGAMRTSDGGPFPAAVS